VALFAHVNRAAAQVDLGAGGPASAAPSRPFEILDNSFLIEEAFNQDAGVFQNIFTWTRGPHGAWNAGFTQEWPMPDVRHQVSYTIPFSGDRHTSGVGDVLLNYRYQLQRESGRLPAIAPRVSAIVPTGRAADGRGAGSAGLQINVPASRQFGNVYLHANAGYTWIGNARTTNVGGSAIWRASPMLHVMLEATTDAGESFTVAPGARRGWNFGERQLVVGAAMPIEREDGRAAAAVLVYASYELRFRPNASASPPQ